MMRRFVLIGALLLAAPAAAQTMDSHALPAAMPADARAAYDWLSQQRPATDSARLEHARNRMRVLHALAAAHGEWMDSAAAQLRSMENVETPAVVRAYAGGLEMLRAKYALWPPRKLDYVRSGRRLLDSAVQSASDDAEVRYVRLVSGHYLPFFLRDDDQVDADARALGRLLPSQAHRFPSRWTRHLAAFVLELGVATEAEATTLRRMSGAR